MRPIEERELAVLLRKQGKTYPEIQKELGTGISKGVLSYWFQDLELTLVQRERIQKQNLKSLEISRLKAWSVNKEKRHLYISSITERVRGFAKALKDKKVGRIVLAILYITEGSRSQKGGITFGNSDPYIISLFLHLLRFCYSIDEQKLRCTVQCRADQNIAELARFWEKVTKIPEGRFCKSQVDPRTIGKPTKKSGYRGVCRINYFSADLSLELRAIAKVIHKGPVV
ncbi:MAG: hypothetical protein EXS51_00910 [Candidatus Taylorbacteria bacterium]|nr:hypothetical protein [Candidatus Taylorbacteria bacterium]